MTGFSPLRIYLQPEDTPMTMHPIGTREEWVSARKELLEREKALTRQSDELYDRGTDWLQ